MGPTSCEWCEVERLTLLSKGIEMKIFLGFAFLSIGLLSICAGTTYNNENKVFLIIGGMLLALIGVITTWKAASRK